MIALPVDWKDGIQLRKWIERGSEEIAQLVLLVRNTDGVIGFHQAATVPSGATDDDKDKALKNAYEQLLTDFPLYAKNQKIVTRFEDGKIVDIPITDTKNSEYFLSSDLDMYNP